MLFEKNPQLALLTCTTCKGVGYKNFNTCPECKGKTAGRVLRGRFLYWGEPLTRYHISVRKAKRLLNRLHIFGALVFGLGFLGFFLFFVYESNMLSEVVTLQYWQQAGNSTQTLFWLSVASFSYLFYRLILGAKPKAVVEHHGYGEAAVAMVADEALPLTWDQAKKKFSRRKQIDIADTFSDETSKVLGDAYELADKSSSSHVTPEHVFYALLQSDKIALVFIRLGIPVKILQSSLAKLFEKTKNKTVPHISEDVQQTFFHAYDAAFEAREDHVYVTDLLVATVRQSPHIQEILYDLNVDKDKLTNVIEWLRIRERLRRRYVALTRAGSHRSKHGLDRAMTAVATPFLNRCSKDLTLAAKYGHLPPVVAREKEIDEIFRIIEGGRQSVLLVGESGVGKMSIVEGITQLMIEDATPKRLQDKRLVQLSTSALMAGATVSGAQERLLKMMREIGKAGNIILFIKNVHDLMTMSNQGEEGLDVSETLAEHLGPGKFLTIATTTPEGYNRHILNSEMGSVFARVDVKEMDENQAVRVLESKAGSFEYKHKVFFSYDALASAVKFSGQFLHDQRLPESAIALMSESASYVKQKKGEQQMVTTEDVAAIVSDKTGIPVTTISEDESSKLLRLEEAMHERVVGQHEAVVLVSSALRRARAEIRSQNRPIANFLFLGPTGVGKTELAKTIANVYFGGEHRMIRIDMSEYQDKSGVYRLIGQPGQQGSGILTEAVRQNPFSLVLFDEMEKADPDVLNLFLQVFDDGRLTDSTGRLIDFTNAIIIATSNAGTQYVADELAKGVSLEDIRQSLIRGELKQYYRPEFLNRFDGIVLFRALEKDEIQKIAGLMLKRVARDLEKRGVLLEVTDEALVALADAGFDKEFGARPMRRAIQDRIENRLAELVLSGKLNRRDTVVIGEGLRIYVRSAKGA